MQAEANALFAGTRCPFEVLGFLCSPSPSCMHKRKECTKKCTEECTRGIHKRKERKGKGYIALYLPAWAA
eukprot:scaffold152541_cov24-Tisochrysis_lutea.AAC.1